MNPRKKDPSNIKRADKTKRRKHQGKKREREKRKKKLDP
jgi:hypothetical protein